MADVPNQKAELNRLVEVLDAIIDVKPRDRLFADAHEKIDFLERAIEVWRFYADRPENETSLETFIQSAIFVDEGHVTIQVPNKEGKLGTGTKPIQLQPPLLLFLLLYHRDRIAIYDIITRFIEKVRDELTVLDFKKTRTGVVRCFTNTRFAALVLRDHGFLKFTHHEAFKTWVLSLPGILVASKLLDDGQHWRIVPTSEMRSRTLHEAILAAKSELDTYDKFVSRLARVCRPNVEVFETFGDVLAKAYGQLPGYWHALEDPSLTKKQRTEETTKRMAELDEMPGMDDFYVEFSKCVNVERLLKEVD
jgi:hypothetical protein